MTSHEKTNDNFHAGSTSEGFPHTSSNINNNNNNNMIVKKKEKNGKNEMDEEVATNGSGMRAGDKEEGEGEGDDEEEDEDEVCRICRTAADVQCPLYFPCACNGSIKFVHKECLLQWLDHSHSHSQCEVCKQSFVFSPIYSRNAPTRLPIQEMFLGFATKVAQNAHTFTQSLLCLSVWFLVVPYFTYWTWKLIFVRNFKEAKQIFIQRCAPHLILMDCLNGLFLSIGIIFVFLGLTSLLPRFHHTQEFIENDDTATPNENIILHDINYDLLVVDEPPPNVRIDDLNELTNNLNYEGQRQLGHQEGLNGEIRVAQLAIPQVQQEEAHEEQIFDGLDDADIDDAMSFDNLMGIEIPLHQLAINAINVLAGNIIFLGLIALIPFLLGRFVLSLATKILTTIRATNELTMLIFLNYQHYTQYFVNNLVLKLNKFTSANKNLFVYKSMSKFGNNSICKWIVGHVSNTLAAATSENSMNTEKILNKINQSVVFISKFSDTTITAIGYLVLFFSISFCLLLTKFINYTNREPTNMDHIYNIHSARRTVAVLSRSQHILRNLRYMCTTLIFFILVTVELGVFPILCGWWLDISAVKIRDVNYGEQISFLWNSRITSCILHWVAGVLYVSHIGSCVNILSEVLQPRAMFFLRNPSESGGNPFVGMVDESLAKHVKRILLSMAMHGGLIATLSYVPACLATSIAPSMFPLNLRVSDPFTESPADLVLFHLCVPFAVEHLRPRAIIKRSLKHWFAFAGWALGLSSFLLPEVENGRDRVGSNSYGWGERQFGERVNSVELVSEGTEVRVNHTFGASVSPDFNVGGGGGNERNVTVWERRCEKLKFATRVVLLLTTAWMSLLVVNTTMILLPITIGRTIFAYVSQFSVACGAIYNDIYAFSIGCYVLWAIVAAARYAVYYLQTHYLGVSIQQVPKWFTIAAKSVVLLSLWFGLIPMLIGLIFELVVIVPLRDGPVDEKPILFLYRDWAFGLVTLKVWTRLVMLGHRIPYVDDSWRVKFEQVWDDGYSRLRGWWVFKEILLPFLIPLFVVLCIPYVLARVIHLALFGYSWLADYATYRYAWSGCLLLALSWDGAKRIYKWFMDLHNAIRDDRYLVGRRLHNFVDRRASKQPPSASVVVPKDSESVAGHDATSPVSRIGSCETLEVVQIEAEAVSAPVSLPTVSYGLSGVEAERLVCGVVEGLEAVAGTSSSAVRAGGNCLEEFCS